jgi:lipopolysaccharide biosynthesis regulator YciM
MPLELLWLLLPAAAASGWWTARRGARRLGPGGLPREYFRGINFLLNEQPDKAIEVFTDMVEVDGETVEPHFALGSLFRRQGEVERAIRIHQSLMARNALSREHRNQALFELGLDYLQAGLLDRAENMLRELLERDPRHLEARRLLIDIYEQEKEWEKAIACATVMNGAGQVFKPVIANYYCELAVQAMDARNFPRVRRMIRRALFHDHYCVRASLLAAEAAHARGHYRTAIRALKRVNKQDPAYLSEAIGLLIDCYERLERDCDAVGYLTSILARQEAFKPVLLFVDYLRRRGLEQEARAFIGDYLQAHPSLPGLAYLIESLLDGEAGRDRLPDLRIARNSLNTLLGNVQAYHCIRCGYGSNVLRWQCPGCRSWNSIRPHQGRAA